MVVPALASNSYELLSSKRLLLDGHSEFRLRARRWSQRFAKQWAGVEGPIAHQSSGFARNSILRMKLRLFST
jgi:hypothetical protein